MSATRNFDNGKDRSEPISSRPKAVDPMSKILIGAREYEAVEVDVDTITLDPDTQPREALIEEVVCDYAAAYKNKTSMPLPRCWKLPDGRTIPEDGYHRIAARKRVSPGKKIKILLHKGSLRELQWWASAANQEHGLRRSSADKRAAAKLALKVNYMRCNLLIASHIGIDDKTVASVRAEMEAVSEIPKLKNRETKDGKSRQATSRKRKSSAGAPHVESAEPEVQQDSIPSVPSDDSNAAPVIKANPSKEESPSPKTKAKVMDLPENVSIPLVVLKSLWGYASEEIKAENLKLISEEIKAMLEGDE